MALALSRSKALLGSKGQEEEGWQFQYREKPTIGARLPFWFRKHWLFAEEVIKSGSMPA